MSDFLKNSPKKPLSNSAKAQWDLDTSPADIPEDIVEWRRRNKQKEAVLPSTDLANVAEKPTAVIPLAKPDSKRVSTKFDSQTDSDLDTHLDSQVDSLKNTYSVEKTALSDTHDTKFDSQTDSDLDTHLDSQVDSVKLTVKQTVNLNANVDSQTDSDLDTHLDSQVDSQFIAQEALAETHKRDWQRILDLGDKAIIECLWINRRSETETRILSFDELSRYSKIPYGTVRYRLRRLRSHALIDTWKRGAIGKLKGNIYSLNLENIAQAIPLLVKQNNSMWERKPESFDTHLDSQVDSQLNTQPHCSSSILNTTTTSEEQQRKKTSVSALTAIGKLLRDEIIATEWEGLDVASLVRYVFQDGKWIHSISELQEFLDKTAAAVEYSKKTKSPITSALGFLHSRLSKWSVDTPPGYESRQERALRNRLEEEKKRLENLNRLNQELAVTRFKSFVAEQQPEVIKELRDAAKKAGKTAPVGGKRVERHHYVSSLVDLFFEKEIVEGITKKGLLDMPELI